MFLVIMSAHTDRRTMKAFLYCITVLQIKTKEGVQNKVTSHAAKSPKTQNRAGGSWLQRNVHCFLKSSSFFISPFIFIPLFLFRFLNFHVEEHVRSRLLEPCRPLNTNAPTLQSFNANQCINNLWSYWFFFFQILYSVIYIQQNHPLLLSYFIF